MSDAPPIAPETVLAVKVILDEIAAAAVDDRLADRDIRVDAEAVIHAADKERGLRSERMSPDPRSTTQFSPQERLVSDWRSVNGLSK